MPEATAKNAPALARFETPCRCSVNVFPVPSLQRSPILVHMLGPWAGLPGLLNRLAPGLELMGHVVGTAGSHSVVAENMAS